MKRIVSLSIILAIAATAWAAAEVHPAGTGYIPNELIVKFRPEVAGELEKQLRSGESANQVGSSLQMEEIKAKYRLREIKPLFKNFQQNRNRFRKLREKETTLLTKKEKHILRRLERASKITAVPDLNRIYKLKVDVEPGQTLNDVLDAYKNDPDVEYAELNYIVTAYNTPNDPLYPVQWALNNTGQNYPASGRYNSPPGTPDSDIDAPQAWDISTGASGIVVAVVDTGVDYNHRDLKDNMWVNQAELNGAAGIDDDGNGYIDDIYGYDFINSDADPKDDNGHGTHCSGIIAAKGDNAADITGVNWNASIMALKFLGSNGSGDQADAIEAFYYAVQNGADVVSNSWGGGGFSQALGEAVEYAYSQGVMMVAAAGNDGTTDVLYPANYDHVFSVAATDSDDQKASFSTYGSWVDIAAPGVDILSLRAAGTSLGTIYDAYTTIASGTSMACPHVAGACASLFSLYPSITLEDLETYLKNSADPIDPNICASGRLNLYQATQQIVSPEGKVKFDRDAYTCSDIAYIILSDSDLAGSSTYEVVVSTDGGDYEIVPLVEMTPYVGIFEGSIAIDSNVPAVGDSVLQVSHNQIITVSYDDADNGTGTNVVAVDTAVIDCEPPDIFDVQIGFPGRQPRITFNTNEPTTGRVLCGLSCAGPYIIDEEDSTLATSHAIELTTVEPETDYFFVVEANDLAGNKTLKTNHGHCYTFTTTGVGVIHVPTQCQTIQQAIDNSWDGGIVLVAEGIYTGQGNRDIDFRARPITVKSENGPKSCVIDCNGTETEPHRAFYFHTGEKNDSVLEGFTITNGHIPGSWYVGIGGAILCENDSSPTITDCIITGNSAGCDGGAICNLSSSPNINNCTFFANAALGNDGGAINNELSSPVITNCTFTANSAYDWGGAIRNIYYCTPVIVNCLFEGNSSNSGGAIYYYFQSESMITNSTFNGNSARIGNSIASNLANDIQIKNCIISDGVNGIWHTNSQPLGMTYSNISGSWPGNGNVDIDPCFVAPGYWEPNGTPADANDDFWVNGDYHLLSQSLCINTGDPNYMPEPNEIDLDGLPRIINGRVDMGAYEFDNRPVADAGPNQIAYAFLNGIADINLDASASYDDENDILDYYWSWFIDPNYYEANGISPAIKLPIGRHEIELIVDDGIDESESDYCTITVIEPLRTSLWFLPNSINCNARPQRILAILQLPRDIEPNDVSEEPLIIYPCGIESQYHRAYKLGRGRHARTMVMAVFNRNDLCDCLPQGRNEVQVAGRLTTGRYFYGTDSIKIITPKPKHYYWPFHRFHN